MYPVAPSVGEEELAPLEHTYPAPQGAVGCIKPIGVKRKIFLLSDQSLNLLKVKEFKVHTCNYLNLHINDFSQQNNQLFFNPVYFPFQPNKIGNQTSCHSNKAILSGKPFCYVKLTSQCTC